VIEAKSKVVKPHDCLPQFLAQLYAFEKQLKTTYMRSELTNGYEWLFIILTINSDDKWGSYRISSRLYSAALQDGGGDAVVPNTLPNILGGILATGPGSNIAIKTFGRMIGWR